MVDAKANAESVRASGPSPVGVSLRRELPEPSDFYKSFLKEPSVGTLLNHIIARLSDDGMVVPDWWNGGRYWHELLYELHKMPDAPESLKKEFFESDGPYPKSVTVKEYLFPLMAHLCVYAGDTVEVMRKGNIELELGEIPYTPKEYQNFLEKAVVLAKERFAPVQDDVAIRLR